MSERAQMQGIACSRQRQEDIINVAKGVKKLQDDGRLESGSVASLTAELLNLSRNTVTKYYKKDVGELSTPGKKRKRKAVVKDNVDDFGKGLIRQIIYGMYDRGEHVTLTSLHTEVSQNEDVGFSGGLCTLRKILLEMGFSWKTTDNRRALIERSDISAARTRYLRQYMRMKEKELNFVFLDETWFFSKGFASKTWQDKSQFSCVRRNLSEGKRYIVVHAGGKKGFVKEAELVFPSQNTTEDYHGTMTAEVFEGWLEDTLLKLEEPSVIVMDNASYHSAHLEKLPTKSWTKAKLKSFLETHNVPYRPEAFHNELYHLALLHKPEKQYKVDEMIWAAGHKVLRLPPYHCHYNPIEMVWSDCKRFYKSHIGTKFDEDNVKKVWMESLNQVTVDKWEKYVAHTEKIVQADWDREVQWDSNDCLQEIIINVGEDTSSSEAIDDEPLAVPLAAGPSGTGM